MPRYFKREGRGKGYEDVTREVAALRADLEQTTDERNALLHARTALRDELEKFADEAEKDAAEILALRAERDEINEEANALSREATTLGAELGRVTAERDAYRDELYECQRERDSWNIAVMHMQPVVEAADAAVDADRQMYHGAAEHAEANMEATFTALYDAVDAFRVATSEQETTDAG